jgi:hypothetical protein
MPTYGLFSRRNAGHAVFHQEWEAATLQEAWFDLITWGDNIEKVAQFYTEYYVHLLDDQRRAVSSYKSETPVICGIVKPGDNTPCIHMSLEDARKERTRRARFVGEEIPE